MENVPGSISGALSRVFRKCDGSEHLPTVRQAVGDLPAVGHAIEDGPLGGVAPFFRFCSPGALSLYAAYRPQFAETEQEEFIFHPDVRVEAVFEYRNSTRREETRHDGAYRQGGQDDEDTGVDQGRVAQLVDEMD